MKILKKSFKGLNRHSAEAPRLNRVAGQLEGIKKMIADGRATTDIIIQIRSARAALKSIEGNMFNRHMQLLLKQTAENAAERNEKLSEMALFFNKFED